MAWHAGSFTLSPGASTRVSYWWGDDHGVQELLNSCSSSVMNGLRVVANTLRATAYGTTRTSDGLTVTYFVDVTNDGPVCTSNFTIIGFGDIGTGA